MPFSVWIDRLRRRARARGGRFERNRNDFVRLGLARLEDRVVLDGAGVVADLQPGAGSSNPAGLTQFNGAYYFTADGTNSSGQSVGRELFRLNADGTVALVADINPGSAGSDPGDFTFFDPNGTSRLLFAATGPQGRELYQLDTSGNVSLVFDVNPGPASSDPVMLSEFSGKLYFTAFTSATGREAYVVNNGGNVSLIADMNPGPASSDPSAFFEFGGNLYYSATVPDGRLLFREAPSGTSDPVLVDLGTGVTDPRDFVTFNNKLYFSALDPTDGRELFAMSVSGSGKETVAKVANLDGSSASSSPGDFFVFGQNLYFSATGTAGRELFRLDTAGNITQLDLASGSASSSPSGFIAFGGDMYFAATTGGTRGMWRLDTSNPSLAAVSVPLPAGVTLPQDALFYPLGTELYFAADGPAGRELYRMNTARVVSLAADVNSGPASSSPAEVILFNSQVYFVATRVDVGRELFVLRRDPSSIRLDGDKLIFTDDDGDKDNRLVISSTGTNLVIVDQNGHTISILTAIAGATGAGTNQVAIPLASLTGITELDVFTRGGNDSVTFDLAANANSILGQFVTSTYDGGTNTAVGDKLRFIGDGITNSVYTPDATTTGSGVVIVSSPSQTLTFNFLALEPVDFTGMAEAKLVTPATVTGTDILAIAPGFDSRDGLLAALIVSGTVGGTAIESGYFFGNQSIVIATGSGVDGTDSITVVGAANAHGNASLTIDTGPLGADTVLVSGNVTLSGQLSVVTQLLNVQATVSLGGLASITTRGDTNFNTSGRLSSSQVAMTAGGAISLADGALIDAGAGTIGLVANGNITLGRLVTTNSTAAAIAVTSQTGSILDAGDSGGPNIVGEGANAVVTLSAAQGIGSAASPLDLAVRNLVVTSGGDQYLSELDNLSSLNLNAGSANIQITAGGQIQDGDTAVDIVAGQLVLSATGVGTLAQPLQTQLVTLIATVSAGDLILVESDGLTVTSAAAPAGNINLRSLAGNITIQSVLAQGLVTLVANTGAILSGAAGTNVTATNLELSAASGIGTAATPLATQVQRLEASGGTGGVFVANLGSLQVGGISPSLLNLTGLAATGSGPIVVGTTVDLTLTEAVHSASGPITLSAGNNLSVQVGGDITSASGPVTLTADSDGVGGGALTLADGTLLDAGSGPITLLATGDITLGRLKTTNATSAAILVRSTAGRILDGGDAGGPDITAEGVGAVTTLQAAGGIGTSGNALDLAVRNLVTTTTNSDQYLAELDDLASLDLNAGSGNIRLTAGGQIQDPDSAVDLRASDLLLVATTAGTWANPLQTQLATLTATATSGDLYFQEQDGLTVTSATASAIGGDIGIVSLTGNLLIAQITANGLVTLWAQAGAIQPTGAAAVQITAHDLELSAASGIGTAATPLATQVQRLEASGGTGGVFVANLGSLQVGGISPSLLNLTGLAATGSGPIVVGTTVDLTLTEAVHSASGPITLSAGNNLSVQVGGDITSASGPVTLTADSDGVGGGALTLADGTLLDAGSGPITLLATGDITLGRLKTTNATSAAILVRSTAGRILDGGDAGGPDITAEGVGAVTTLQAAGGIGTSGNALDLAVRNLVTTTTNSDQYLAELDDLASLDLNAGSGNIRLTAGGQIQDPDSAVDLRASDLLLVATTAGTWASPLQTQLATLTATATSGDLYFQEQDGLTVTSATASAIGGDIGIVSLTGNLLIAQITANGLVTLWAQAGAIQPTGAAAVQITAHDLELSAASGIGTAATPLATQVQRLEASGGTGGVFVANLGSLQVGGISPSLLNLTGLAATGSGPIVVGTTVDLTLTEAVHSASGPITLSAGNNLSVQVGGDITSASGPVTLTADSDGVGGGALTLADGTLLDAGSGPITLLATGDITLGRLKTTNATSAAILVRSTAGRILDGGDAGGPDITAEGVGAVTTLQAAGGIGTSGNALDLAVRNLVTTTTNSDQYLAELDDLASLDLNAGSGNIRLTAGGQIQDPDSAVDLRASDLLLVATTAGTWANPLQTQLATLTATATSGDLYFQEQDGLTVTSATASAIGGDIGIVSLTGNLLIAQITANGLVTLWAQAGAIQPTGAAAVQITAHDLELSAASGIGTAATPLATQVQRLEASGGTGGVFVANLGSLQVGGISPSLLNLTGLAATGSGPIVVGTTVDLTLTEAVHSASGPITLSAGNNLSVQVGGDITSASGPVTLTADSDGVGGGALTLADGTLLDAGSGPITLLATGDITLGRLKTTNATSAAILVRSTAGRILDGGDAGGPDITAEGVGAVTTLQAAGGIGTSGNALDLAVRNLVTTTTNSDQYLAELDDLASLDLAAGSGNIRLTAGGQIQDPDSAVDLRASDLLLVATTAGTWANPLQTQLATLTATATSGDLYFQEQDGLTVTSATASAIGGDIGIVSLTGNLLIAQITANGLVTLWAQAGAIQPTGAAAVQITAHDLELSAASGIGTAVQPLATQVQRLEASGGTGGVFVANLGSLQVGGISPSLLNLTGLAATGSGPIVVGTTVDLTLTEAVHSASGPITLSAGNNLSVQVGGDITSVSGPVTLTADSDGVGGGALTLADGTLLDAGSGPITLLATGDITLGRLKTTNATSAAILVRSTAGRILDGGDAGGPDITAEGVGAVTTLQAAGGIGTSGNALDLAVRNLVTTTTNSDQYLAELDDLASLDLNAGSGNIRLTAGGQIQDPDSAVDIVATGLAIAAQGAGTAATPLQANIASLEAEVGAGGLFLSDVGGLELGGVTGDLMGVHSSGGPIRLVTTGSILASEAVGAAGNGKIDLIATGNITLMDHVASAAGDITLSAAGDVVATANSGLETNSGTMLLWADTDNLGGGTIQFAGHIDVGMGKVVFRFPAADGQLSGSIQGQGGVVKEGPGTLTMTATSINTYTGTTQLLAGTLRVDGAIGAAGPAATVFLAGGTKLTGSGDVNAPIFASDTTALIVSLGDLKLGDGSAAGFNFAGTLLVAGGDHVTLRDADLAQLGVLTMIASGGHLTALGGVEVGNHERLAGSGAVSGNIVVLAGGVVSPGASPGVVSTATGNVVLQANSIYLAEIGGVQPGSEYDQINVQGTVDISGAVLSLGGGSFRPPTGTIFTLIENDDAGGIADRVTGQFAGLGEGATVRFGGIEATISYVGGTGNDVTLTVTDLRIIRTNSPQAAGGRSDTGGGGAIVLAQKSEAAPVLITQSSHPVAIAQGTDARPQALDTRAVERLRVFLKVVDEVTGKEEGKAVDLDPRVIDDVLGFFQRHRFPNGKYRIYLQEANKSPRLIVEISIRDGRAVSPEGQQAIPKQDAPARELPAPKQPVQPAAPAAAPMATNAADGASGAIAADQSPTNKPLGNDHRSDPIRGVVKPAGSVHRWTGLAAGLAAGLVLAGTAPAWRQRIGRLLAESNQIPRTRFHRRLPKIVPPTSSTST